MIRSAAQRSTAFYHACLFYGIDKENVPVHFVSILRVFCNPNLIFDVARNLEKSSQSEQARSGMGNWRSSLSGALR